MRTLLNYKLRLLTILLIAIVNLSIAQSVDEKFSNANDLLFEKKYEEALSLYQEITKETSDSIMLSSVYGYGASCYENLNNDSMALVFCKNAVLYKTGEYAVYNKLYTLARKLKDQEMQEFALKAKIVEFPSENAKSYEKLAFLYVSKKEFDKLIKTCDLLIEMKPDKSKFQYLKGYGLESLGKKEEAKASYLKAIELKPDDYASNLGLGYLLYNEATLAFDKEQKRYGKLKNPDWRKHMAYMDEIKRVRTMYEKARPYMEKACSIKCTDQLKSAIEKLKSRIDKE